jgi:hypothetical protein
MAKIIPEPVNIAICHALKQQVAADQIRRWVYLNDDLEKNTPLRLWVVRI